MVTDNQTLVQINKQVTGKLTQVKIRKKYIVTIKRIIVTDKNPYPFRQTNMVTDKHTP